MFNVERSGEETRKLSHNNDRCVGCGICTDVCPTSSLRLGPIVPIARGLIEMDLVSVTSNTCVLCGLCSVACPFDALSLTINGNDIKETGNYQYAVPFGGDKETLSRKNGKGGSVSINEV